jgi:hypothetical protein
VTHSDELRALDARRGRIGHYPDRRDDGDLFRLHSAPPLVGIRFIPRRKSSRAADPDVIALVASTVDLSRHVLHADVLRLP